MTAAWLKQVQSEKDRLPLWLKNVFEHPQFRSLSTESNGGEDGKPYWWITTNDEQELDDDSLAGVCQKFVTHYRLAGQPPKAADTEDAVKEHIRQLENALAEVGATVQWVQDAAEGAELSEFAQSFGVVRLIMDLRARNQQLEAQLRDQ